MLITFLYFAGNTLNIKVSKPCYTFKCSIIETRADFFFFLTIDLFKRHSKQLLLGIRSSSTFYPD